MVFTNICHRPCVYLKALMGTLSRTGPESGGRTRENFPISWVWGPFQHSATSLKQAGLAGPCPRCWCACLASLITLVFRPVWSVNRCLGVGGAVTTNSKRDRGLTRGLLSGSAAFLIHSVWLLHSAQGPGERVGELKLTKSGIRGHQGVFEEAWWSP